MAHPFALQDLREVRERELRWLPQRDAHARCPGDLIRSGVHERTVLLDRDGRPVAKLARFPGCEAVEAPGLRAERDDPTDAILIDQVTSKDELTALLGHRIGGKGKSDRVLDVLAGERLPPAGGLDLIGGTECRHEQPECRDGPKQHEEQHREVIAQPADGEAFDVGRHQRISSLARRML